MKSRIEQVKELIELSTKLEAEGMKKEAKQARTLADEILKELEGK